MKKNYDSDFCGSLPLSFINQTQPYGLLIVVQKTDLNIVQVSMNIETILNVSVDDVIDKPLSQFILASNADSLNRKFSSGLRDKLPITITFDINGKQKEFLSIVHVKDDMLIMELEESSNYDDDSTFISIYQEIKYAMSAISNADGLQEASDIAVNELKKLSGFDRVMLYQFDEDWNGMVIAETKEDDMEPYLGLRFPASDIPKQARDLYYRNPYRQIPDRNYNPVKLYPVVNSVTQAFTDLSDCNLRAVANVHLEYLANMGVTASMSTRVLKDNKLWGLISCHHKTPKFLNYEKCSVFELLSGIISQKLSSLQNEETFHHLARLQELQARLVEQIYADDNIIDGLFKKETTILDLLNAEGAVILYRNNIELLGKTPKLEQIRDLVLWLQSQNTAKTYSTSALSEVYDVGSQYTDVASGMVVLPIRPERGEYIIVFRPEIIRKVNWGGNPDEAINFEADKKTYHPRNSFKDWQQIVKHTSEPWRKEELDIAEDLRNTVIEYTLRKM